MTSTTVQQGEEMVGGRGRRKGRKGKKGICRSTSTMQSLERTYHYDMTKTSRAADAAARKRPDIDCTPPDKSDSAQSIS